MGRTVRHLLAVIPALVCAAAPAAHAQQLQQGEPPFANSWFWGLHAGTTSVGTATAATSQVATVGAEWMITRTDGGVYVAYDQSNFSRMGGVSDSTSANGMRPVSIRNLRSASLGALAFPWHQGGFRPYAGGGFTLSVIGSASVRPDALNTPTPPATVQAVENARSRSSLFALAGAQWQVSRTAIFAQASFVPASGAFPITKPMPTFVAGVRYNVGSATSN